MPSKICCYPSSTPRSTSSAKTKKFGKAAFVRETSAPPVGCKKIRKTKLYFHLHDHPISKGERTKKEKKDPPQATWKDALLEMSVELAFVLLSAAIGFGIVSLFPLDMIDDEAMDLFIFIGGFILVAVIALVAFIIHIMKTNRKTKDLQRIYRSLKGKFTLTLMTVTRKKTEKRSISPSSR